MRTLSAEEYEDYHSINAYETFRRVWDSFGANIRVLNPIGLKYLHAQLMLAHKRYKGTSSNLLRHGILTAFRQQMERNAYSAPKYCHCCLVHPDDSVSGCAELIEFDETMFTIEEVFSDNDTLRIIKEYVEEKVIADVNRFIDERSEKRKMEESEDDEYSSPLERRWLTTAYNRLLSGGCEHDEIIRVIKSVGWSHDDVIDRFSNEMNAKRKESEDENA